MRHRRRMILTLRGRIVGVGFASGHRVVIGHWDDSPIGAFVDVMWAHPGGERVLFAESEGSVDFISAVYGFDRCVVGPLEVDRRTRALSVTLPDRAVAVQSGRRIPLLGPRPRAFTRRIEAPIGRRVMGVETYGTSPTGVREWYQARWWAPLVSAVAMIDGMPLGQMAPVDPPCRFGFSEPPRRPSITEVRPKLLDPSGHLDEVVRRRREAGAA